MDTTSCQSGANQSAFRGGGITGSLAPGSLGSLRRPGGVATDPRRLGLWPGRVGLLDSTLRMDARLRIHDLAADWATWSRRGQRGRDVVIPGIHHERLPSA